MGGLIPPPHTSPLLLRNRLYRGGGSFRPHFMGFIQAVYHGCFLLFRGHFLGRKRARLIAFYRGCSYRGLPLNGSWRFFYLRRVCVCFSWLDMEYPYSFNRAFRGLIGALPPVDNADRYRFDCHYIGSRTLAGPTNSRGGCGIHDRSAEGFWRILIRVLRIRYDKIAATAFFVSADVHCFNRGCCP